MSEKMELTDLHINTSIGLIGTYIDGTKKVLKCKDVLAALRASSPAQEINDDFILRAKAIVAEGWRQTMAGHDEFDEYTIPLIASALAAQAAVSSPAQEPVTTEPVAWFVEGARPLNHSEVFMHHANAVAAFSAWGGKITPLGPLAIPALPQPGRKAIIEECAKVAESFRRQMLPGDDRILIRKIEDAIRALGEPK